MSLRRYQNYRDSGTEWLGEVPEHWTTVPIKRLGSLKGGAGFPHNEQGVEGEELSFHKVNALASAGIDGVLLASENTISREKAALLGAFVFPPKSIVFAKVGAALLLGRIRMLGENACIDNNMMGLVICQPEHDVGFVKYALSLVRFDLIASPGTVPSLNEAQIGNFPLVFPKTEEQQGIAAFLHRETAKIDALITEQQRLIKLLKEKRQGVISHAVTKGLVPDVPMKDSGVEWLGEVPEHWEIMPLKRGLVFLTSGSRGWADHYSEDGALFIRIGNLTRDSIRLDLSDIQRVSVPDGTEGERTKVQRGDVLFSITAYLGSVAVVAANLESAYVSQHVALARVKLECLLPEWVAYVTLSFVGRTYLETQGYGGTKIQLSLDDVANLVVTVPDVGEQSVITAFLDRETAKLDALIAEAKTAITLLQERRIALISAAVTGKIDVRGLAAQPSKEEVAA